jgi:type IV pilus assembly protein PilA
MQRERFGARADRATEEGFTLIELMMVVLIIGILIAVLTPTFLGASQRAKDRAAQGTLHDALIDASTVYSDNADYTLATFDVLQRAETSIHFVDASQNPTSPTEVSVYPANASYIVLSSFSKSGTCFYVSDDKSGPGVLYAQAPGAGGCDAGSAPLAGDPAWQSKW